MLANHRLKTLFPILLYILFIAISAQLTLVVPVGESTIPITGQTYAVLTGAALLGSRTALLGTVLYVLFGGIGLPIFADGKVGWIVVFGNSSGFLLGFIIAGYLVGKLGERGWNASLSKIILSMTLGTLVILLLGISRLTYTFGLEKGLAYGFYPFWQGAVVKIIAGALTVWGITHWLNAKRAIR